jgi:hypothetical protein
MIFRRSAAEGLERLARETLSNQMAETGICNWQTVRRLEVLLYYQGCDPGGRESGEPGTVVVIGLIPGRGRRRLTHNIPGSRLLE